MTTAITDYVQWVEQNKLMCIEQYSPWYGWCRNSSINPSLCIKQQH